MGLESPHASAEDKLAPDFDVVIVGCGPVGATLALALGQRGVRVLAIERETSIYHLPRAVAFDGEILRVYQSLGVADGIASVSVPMRGFRYENSNGQALIDWPLPQDATGPQGWGATYMFHQPDVEVLLRDRMAELPTVELWDGREVVGLTQDEDAVTLTARTIADDTTQAVTAAFAVGCDGGASFTRRAIESTFETLGPTQDWVVIDAVKRRELDLPEVMIGYCWTSRPHFFVPMREPRLRWEFMVLDGDDREAISTPEGAYDLIERFATRDDVSIQRAAIYKFRSSLAERWREGRVFLAGDAAHLQPPLRAQGLCSGIRDAMNLSWKLGAVLDEEANPGLLDTYEPERRAHARAWIQIATELSAVINTTDPGVAATRDAHMLANPIPYSDETPPLGPGLHGDAPQPAGVLSHQAVSQDGTRLDDETGGRFLVVMTPELLSALSSDARGALADHRWFHTLDPQSPEARELLAGYKGASALVVRPDRYVLGVAADAANIEELLQRWTAYRHPYVAP